MECVTVAVRRCWCSSLVAWGCLRAMLVWARWSTILRRIKNHHGLTWCWRVQASRMHTQLVAFGDPSALDSKHSHLWLLVYALHLQTILFLLVRFMKAQIHLTKCIMWVQSAVSLPEDTSMKMPASVGSNAEIGSLLCVVLIVVCERERVQNTSVTSPK